jgi:hypothetical protein
MRPRAIVRLQHQNIRAWFLVPKVTVVHRFAEPKLFVQVDRGSVRSHRLESRDSSRRDG